MDRNNLELAWPKEIRMETPSLLPHRFLFRYSFPVRYTAKLPRAGKKLLGLDETHRLPETAALDGGTTLGDLRLAWNETGLGISLHVRGKKHPVTGDTGNLEQSDVLFVWIDTRNTQNIHRASRFCHQFCLMAAGNPEDDRAPHAFQSPIPRAREEAPLCKPEDLRVSTDAAKGGYLLEAWLPSKALHGFDPEAQPRLGFYYYLHDTELGDQYLTVGPEFPFAADPSLWGTLELVSP